MKATVATLLGLGALLASAAATADDAERRVTAVSTSSVVGIAAVGGTGSALGLGGGLEAAWGVGDYLEFGGGASYSVAPDLRLDDASFGGERGTAFVDYHSLRVGGAGRASGYFTTNLRPFVVGRAGLQLRRLTNPVLLTPDLSGPVDVSVPGTSAWLGWAGADLGVSWRIPERWSLAVAATSRISADERTVGLQLELSFLTYDWL